MDDNDKSAVDTRLRFLTSAALLYAPSVAATSAHLMLQGVQVADENGRPFDIEGSKDVFCRVCGTISSGAETSLASEKRGQSLDAVQTESTKKATASPLDFEPRCSACHHFLRQPVAAKKTGSGPGSWKQQSLARAGKSDHSLDVFDNVNAKTLKPSKVVHANVSANASSKQRAKARKQGGLQAMVDQSRKRLEPDASSGLDLMDFMKAR